MESITTNDMFGIDLHFAPSALGVIGGDDPGALPQAFTLRALGAF
jgi:hypothetical protein